MSRRAGQPGQRFVPPPIVPDAQALDATRQREQAAYNAWLLERQPRRAPVVIDASEPRRDPVLIGVVILGTTSFRGLWVSFSKWEH